MKNTQTEYEAMVKRLFKTGGFHSQYEGLVHALIGLASEVDELREAVSYDKRENLVEELGDFKFYFQAAIAQILWIGNCEQTKIDTVYVTTSINDEIDSCDYVQDKVEYIVNNCCMALDEVKRGWVYGKDVNYTALLGNLVKVIKLVDHIAEMFEISNEEILAANMHKLENVDTGRYKEKKYSDEAAIARSDKGVPIIDVPCFSALPRPGKELCIYKTKDTNESFTWLPSIQDYLEVH